MDKPTIKQIILIILIIIFLIGLYFFLDKVIKKDNDGYVEYLKDYKVNEYIPSYISDEAMAKIYLNDYIHTMYSNIDDGYNLLDKEYRDKRFGNIESYRSYVNSLNYPKYEVDRYFKVSSDGYIIFGVYDKNDNFFAFKTKGVMQYSVYLDENTVEIW